MTWKDKLQGQIREDWAREIDNFEALIALRKQGKVDEKVFAEQRLRRGAYGQRYDNGQRHDGLKTQKLPYPSLTKGPDTHFDAPGMQRIKIPFGAMNPAQMRVIADLAEEYSDSIVHITTRQDVQLHFVHIDETPSIFRRLAAVGVTSREACGNSVRNVTACPLAGVCHTEKFDVSPYAKACAFYMLGHPDTMDFGRKFKIAFSGCAHEACALVSMHDLGGIAATKVVDGKEVKGFEIYVGGGLGAVPYQAKLLAEFVTEDELLPLCRAVGRVFARLGEKKNRNKARVKFVVAKLGIEKFREAVNEELRTMPPDPVDFRKFLAEIPKWDESPREAGAQTVQLSVNGKKLGGEYDKWVETNVYRQRQPGYSTVTVTLPLGDASAEQFRELADLVHKYASDHLRTTVEQNVVLRWVKNEHVPALYEALKAIDLSEGGAGTIVDVVTCPGTDTCKLGIASSRGLAGELRHRLAAKNASLDAAIRNLRIKVSGCFNSCGQHHVADIGFYGNTRTIGGFNVPHFQVMLGGQWSENAGSYALALGAIPSKRIPELVDALTDRFVTGRNGPESFQAWCQRVGKKELKTIVDQFDVKTRPAPAHAVEPGFYSDWGDPRQYSGTGDIGVGECAGEVISLADFGFTEAESMAFESQLLLDDKEFQKADELGYKAMLKAAWTLVQLQWHDVPASDPNFIVNEFRTRFVDTKLFWDTYHHGQFANYLFNRHEVADERFSADTAKKTVEEANLFIDAAHKAHAKYQQSLNVLGGAGAGAFDGTSGNVAVAGATA
jgi:sulfite reductase (ferredoxin)